MIVEGAPSSELGQEVSERLVRLLHALGVDLAFGLIGGAIAPVYHALSRSPIRTVHCRHEAGATFAAAEASLASNRPAAVFTTSGPGLANSITGLMAARQEGARVILVAGMTSPPLRGRGAFQETTIRTFGGLLSSSAIFHWSHTIEHPAEIHEVAQRLAFGLSSRAGFVAALCVPVSLQRAECPEVRAPRVEIETPACDEQTVERAVELLSEGPFWIWVGFGAREAAPQIRALAERTGARVVCTPRGKGIFPEDHPSFVGVTGLGGHDAVNRIVAAERPHRVLVLGSRLGEFSSFWDPSLVPPAGLVHVDVNPSAFGAAYPEARTFGVRAEIGWFVSRLLGRFKGSGVRIRAAAPRPLASTLEPRDPRGSRVHPADLMKCIQRVIVDRTRAVVMTEAGNAFSWGTHALRFTEPGRYRTSVGFGSMGHAAAGVLGAAMATGNKAVAVVGDGAMLMLNEVSTAVAHRVPAVWIVLNDGRYGMTEVGMRSVGFEPIGLEVPQTDFAVMARALGARGIRVRRERDLPGALEQAVSEKGPFVVDVPIDPSVRAPMGKRNDALLEQWRKGRAGAMQ